MIGPLPLNSPGSHQFEMMDDFAPAVVETGETSIFLRSYGSGPPILLLHGFPQTHLMWRGVAPLLARKFTIVCVQGQSLSAGHFFPEEAPEQTADALERFFGDAKSPS